MKKFLSIVAAAAVLFGGSLPAMAAASAPPRVSFLSGTTVTASFNMSSPAANSFFHSVPYIQNSYIVAVSRYLDYGMRGTAPEVEDGSGDYSYLHFISVGKSGNEFEFGEASSDAVCPVVVGVQPTSSYLNVLTYQYNPKTGAFDDGTLRQVTSGIKFDYVIAGGPLSGSGNLYPAYGMIGGAPLHGTYNLGYNWWIGKMETVDNTHTLTVKYRHADGSQAAPSYSQKFIAGYPYKITSPNLSGYSADKLVVTGKMPSSDLEVTVTYQAVDPDRRVTLRIRYVYRDYTEAAPDYVAELYPLDAYNVDSPVIPGFIANMAVAKGQMTSKDLTITVMYWPDDGSGGSSGGGDDGGGGSSGGGDDGGGGSSGGGDDGGGGSSGGGDDGGGGSSGGGGGNWWNPGNVDLDKVLPEKPPFTVGDFIFNLFNPFGYNNYKAPAEEEYDPLKGLTVQSMPDFPDIPMGDYSDPFDAVSSPGSAGDPFDKGGSSSMADPFDDVIPIGGSDPFDGSWGSSMADPFDDVIPFNGMDPFDSSGASSLADPFDSVIPFDAVDPFVADGIASMRDPFDSLGSSSYADPFDKIYLIGEGDS